jgi:co-chaperonin GroES (HSP10)
MFGKHAGQPVKADGKEYLILTEDDVMAIVE